MITVNLDKHVPKESTILNDHPKEIGDSWMDKVKEYQKHLLLDSAEEAVKDH